MEMGGAMEVFSAEHLLVSQPVEAGRTRVAALSQGGVLVKHVRLQNVLGSSEKDNQLKENVPTC